MDKGTTNSKHNRSYSSRLRQSQRLKQSQHLRQSQYLKQNLRKTARVRYAKNLQPFVNANGTKITNGKPKKHRFNINLQNKNIKLLKRPIPIIPVRKEIEQLNLYFQKLMESPDGVFHYEYAFANSDIPHIQSMLHTIYDNILVIINKIKKLILNEAIVNSDTSIYNYYVTNFENLQNEIYKNFTEIKPTNARTLRFQLKQIKSYINSYIENILN